jgi:hypothetical protein
VDLGSRYTKKTNYQLLLATSSGVTKNEISPGVLVVVVVAVSVLGRWVLAGAGAAGSWPASRHGR